MEEQSAQKKSAPVVAWLGFSFSLVVLLIVLLVLYVAYNGNSMGLYALSFLIVTVGLCFWILGLVFSINGLRISARNNRTKWVGAFGVIFSIASVLSIIIPLVVFSLKEDNKRYDRYDYALSDTDSSFADMAFSVAPESPARADSSDNNVVVTITRSSDILCNDNRSGSETVPAKIRVYSYKLKHELSTWLKMNNISKGTTIIIKSNQSADYSDVVKVIDTLKELGYNNIKMEHLKS